MEERDTNQTGNLTLAVIQEVCKAASHWCSVCFITNCNPCEQAIQSVDPLSSPIVIANALLRGLGLTSRSQLVMHDIVEYRPLLKVGVVFLLSTAKSNA